jgi:ubiquinol-cytochrome c reductase iron-sulfur subunit
MWTSREIGATNRLWQEEYAAQSRVASPNSPDQIWAVQRDRLKVIAGRNASVNDATSAVEPSRRDILFVATGAAAAVAVGGAAWPLIAQMNPDASTLALSSTELDISAIQPGQIVTVKWRGKPVFVRHRTKDEIEAAEKVSLSDLPDPEPDSKRVQKPEWLVVIGVCTHLGCIPLGHEGEFNGWFCPCHGSTYDTSGRIRSGPAPTNLEVPKYAFIGDTKIKIG